jgi:hypothetical protein
MYFPRTNKPGKIARSAPEYGGKHQKTACKKADHSCNSMDDDQQIVDGVNIHLKLL